MTFPQLHTQTAYTLLQSTIKLTEYVQEAKKLGYQTLGIADVNVMHGSLEFFQTCKKAGLNSVQGLTLTYRKKESEESQQIVLFAKNYLGYQNLMWLSSKRMITEKDFDLHEFPERYQHLYGVLPSTNQVRSSFFKTPELASQELAELVTLFGKGNLYAGVSLEDIPENDPEWFGFLAEQGIPLLAFQMVCYLQPTDAFALKTLSHIQAGTIFEENLNQLAVETNGADFLRSEKEVRQAYNDLGLQLALDNAEKLAATCQFELPLHQKLLPSYPLTTEQTAGSYLKELCTAALSKRISSVTAVYQERLAYELEIIHTMGFDDYFLIVWDVMRYVHQQNIVTGAGRGSAAGSLVAYVLEITDVDPIKYNLLFERFLNPERYTMPDIDLDIPDNRRNEVLLYVREKYGAYHMAQIATFGTMAAKMVLRDVARTFALSQNEANLWAKAVPNSLKMTLTKAYQESKALVDLVNASEKNRLLFETALKLEGLPRHVSTHAAGVVISDQNLLPLVPLQVGSEDIFLTQFTMNDVETLGLLKMDFLGLRNLAIIDRTLQGIKRVFKKELILNQLPLDDPATLALFQKGETTGVFQFESSGIRNVLRKLEPNDIEDIAAVNALYRPGPMQNIDTFIRRKKGLEPIVYPDESLEPILSNTYGIIVYQEQIMQVAAKMAGYSLGQADILRRAISKKKKQVLDEERQNFVAGAKKQGYPEAKANEIYDYIEHFANYGFNRSHAFAYSFVGFYMGYLKVHYPAPFFNALLHSAGHTPTKVREYIGEAKRYQVTVAPPDINYSSYSFQLVDEKQIRFGLGAIKGIRRDFVKDIIEERQAGGPYRSFDQFLIRIPAKWLKIDTLTPLIAIGVFDQLHGNRRQLLYDLDGKIKNVLYSGGSMDLLGLMELKEEEMADFSLEEKLTEEEKYLGLYLSGHPTENYQKIQMAKQVSLVSQAVVNERGRFLLYLKSNREIRTKKGEQMAFLTGSDVSGEIDITVFPKLYRKIRQDFQLNTVYYVEGKVERSKYNQEIQLLAEEMEKAAELTTKISEQTCYLRITEKLEQPAILEKLKHILKEHPGHVPIVVFYQQSGKKIGLAAENWIDDSQTVKNQLSYLLGAENVVFK